MKTDEELYRSFYCFWSFWCTGEDGTVALAKYRYSAKLSDDEYDRLYEMIVSGIHVEVV